MINLLERRTDFACGSLNKAGMAELVEIFSHELSAGVLTLIRCLAGELTCPVAPQ